MQNDNNILYITSNEQLELILPYVNTAQFISLDSEFLRYDPEDAPKLALLQFKIVGSVKGIIDPLLCDVAPFLKCIFENHGLTKILHDGRQDLEIFAHIINFKDEFLNSVADTQVFDLFLAYYKNGTPSYKDLVNKYCFKNIDKACQNSKWLKRPLSKNQLKYAINDVEYLFDIYQQQKENLIAKKRDENAREYLYEVFFNYIHKIKHEKHFEDFVDLDEVNEIHRRLHNTCEFMKITPLIIANKYDIKKILSSEEYKKNFKSWKLEILMK